MILFIIQCLTQRMFELNAKLHSKEKKKNILFTAMTQRNSLCYRHRRDDDRTLPQLKKKNSSEMLTSHYFIIDGQILLYFRNDTEVCYIYIFPIL
jgi:hypothetical protein